MDIKSEKINILSEGNIHSKFSTLSGKMGTFSIRAMDHLKLSIRTSYPCIIFTEQHSEITIFTKKKEFTLATNSLLILNANLSFEIQKLTPHCQLSLLFPTWPLIEKTGQVYQLNATELNEIFSRQIQLPQNTWLEQIFQRYTFSRQIEKNTINFANKFLEFEIIKEIFYLNRMKNNPKLKDTFPINEKILSRAPKVVEDAIQYIEKNLLGNLNLEMVINEISISRSTLSRHFNQVFGKSPWQFIKERRLQEAHLILRSTNFNVGEVSQMIKYENPSIFIKEFKKKFGKTPFEIIKDQRNRHDSNVRLSDS